MSIDITDSKRRARHAIKRLLLNANGGTTPRIDIYVVDNAAAPMPPFDPDAASANLFVHVTGDGRLFVTVGIRVHRETLWQSGFRMARMPGGQLYLLGLVEGRPGYFVVADDRLWGEAGSPMPSSDGRRRDRGLRRRVCPIDGSGFTIATWK